jgi:photosystem II stability/assembly factor-like uncharacterized protein
VTVLTVTNLYNALSVVKVLYLYDALSVRDSTMRCRLAINETEGWILANTYTNSFLLRYRNGEWEEVSLPEDYIFTAMSMLNSEEGWLAGKEGLLAAKLNGQKWPEQMELRRNKKRPGEGLWRMSGVK